MEGRYITIIVAPDDGTLKRFRIHRSTFYVALSVIGIIIVGSVMMIAVYGSVFFSFHKLHKLEEENRTLKENQKKLAKLEQELNEMRKLRQQIFKMLEVDESSPTSRLREKQMASALPEEKTNIAFTDPEIARLAYSVQEERSRLPSGLPAKGYISATFGETLPRFKNPHTGVDIALPEKTPVFATASGIVEYTGDEPQLGKVVRLNHLNGYKTVYGHLSSIAVSQGKLVRKGELVGLSGNTGKSTSPHLHYEILFHNIPQDPMKFLRKKEKKDG
ncbi:peptidoglycan DD-metalloendopeptidase family protein [bacterium]|nr:peptidoglycan DD-metalloendopeptidase family protein [bacterium]